MLAKLRRLVYELTQVSFYHWDRLEHNNWSTGSPALSSDFHYSEHLGEQVVREWLAGEKSQSARESYGVFSH